MLMIPQILSPALISLVSLTSFIKHSIFYWMSNNHFKISISQWNSGSHFSFLQSAVSLAFFILVNGINTYLVSYNKYLYMILHSTSLIPTLTQSIYLFGSISKNISPNSPQFHCKQPSLSYHHGSCGLPP